MVTILLLGLAVLMLGVTVAVLGLAVAVLGMVAVPVVRVGHVDVVLANMLYVHCALLLVLRLRDDLEVDGASEMLEI